MLDIVRSRYARLAWVLLQPGQSARVVSWDTERGPGLSVTDRLRLDPSVLAAGTHRSGA